MMVDFLRGQPQALSFIKANADKIALSSIVVAELYAGVKGAHELSVLDDLISFCLILTVTREVAKAGGLYKKEYARSHGVRLADAIIAATAQVESIDLKTLNNKHYPMLDGVNPPYVKN